MDDEIEILWNLALIKNKSWQTSDFPVVRDSTAQLKRAWSSARQKKRISNGDLVTVEMVQLQWQAESIARRKDRQHKVFVPQPVGVSVWLNGERWNNEIITEERKVKESAYCQCGQETHGPSYDKCAHCMGFKDGKMIGWAADKMREYYKSHPEISYEQLKGLNQNQAYRVIKQLLAGNKNILLDKQ